MNPKLFLLLFLSGFTGIAIHAQIPEQPDTLPAYADTMYRQLNEVVVTATRAPERIIDIPYPVLRIGYSDIKFERKIGANDMLSAVPGLFLQSRYGDHDVRFSIRGFGSRSNSGIRGVRILLDGIPESEPDGQTRIEAIDFNTLSGIEIIKGSASSLYTNAPGGVVNFSNDITFERSSVSSFNEMGSFGLLKNGIKSTLRTDQYGLLAAYSYMNYDGYRVHNHENWSILNIVAETNPTPNTNLQILGYFVDGIIRLPGSLTRAEFDQDPFQADPKSLSRDEKRLTTKGRLGIRFTSDFGPSLNNEVQVTAYGSIKYLERCAKEYRIVNRNIMGFSASYLNRTRFSGRTNEFSVGGDLYTQPARTEYYENFNGTRGDQIMQLTTENISNAGCYFSDNFTILPRKLSVLLTGRFDHVGFRQSEETSPSRADRRVFNAFTPKLSFSYKLTPSVAVYTSYCLSFDSPASNELDSPDPAYLYNSDLNPQESQNVEAGIKGVLVREDAALFLRRFLFEATGFGILISNTIVPYEVLGEVYYRNAAESNRLGFELGTEVELLRNLNFISSYTFSYFRYVSYVARTIEIDTTGQFIVTDKDFSGHLEPSVPRHNLFLGLSYAWPVSKHFSLFAKVSYNGISGLWVDDENSARTNPYNLLNSLVGAEMRFGRFNILLSGGMNNMLDEVYVGFTNTNSATKRFYEAGAPRDYFINLNLGYTF
jgi:iron complex outermembrane receptor protein